MDLAAPDIPDSLIVEARAEINRQLAKEFAKDHPELARLSNGPLREALTRTVLALLRLRDRLPPRPPLPYPRAWRGVSKFDTRPLQQMTLEERTFGSWLRISLGRAAPGWTPGQAIDCLMDLGFTHPVNDFQANIHRFAKELTRHRRARKSARGRLLTWADVLEVARKLGWSRGDLE